MIDLKPIGEEIAALQKALNKKESEYEKAQEANLQEQYGGQFGCDYCAYSCCVEVGDYHTCCDQQRCIYCNDYCDKYVPENKLSEYIRDKHYYDSRMLGKLSRLLGVNDIILEPELHNKALDVLFLIDKKEN